MGAARELLEADGLEALTMRRVAGRLGIREPSLYKHARNRDDLLAAVVATGMRELAEGRLGAVQGATGVADAVDSLATYQREFATRHRHLYRLMFDRPFPRELLATSADAEAWRPVVELLGSEERVWVAFAFAHGMLELERTGRLPPGQVAEAVWRLGIEAIAGLAGDRPRSAPVNAGLERELRAYRELVAGLSRTISTFAAERPVQSRM